MADPIQIGWDQLFSFGRYVLEVVLIPLLVNASRQFKNMSEEVKKMGYSLSGVDGSPGVIKRLDKVEQSIVELFHIVGRRHDDKEG